MEISNEMSIDMIHYTLGFLSFVDLLHLRATNIWFRKMCRIPLAKKFIFPPGKPDYNPQTDYLLQNWILPDVLPYCEEQKAIYKFVIGTVYSGYFDFFTKLKDKWRPPFHDIVMSDRSSNVDLSLNLTFVSWIYRNERTFFSKGDSIHLVRKYHSRIFLDDVADLNGYSFNHMDLPFALIHELLQLKCEIDCIYIVNSFYVYSRFGSSTLFFPVPVLTVFHALFVSPWFAITQLCFALLLKSILSLLPGRIFYHTFRYSLIVIAIWCFLICNQMTNQIMKEMTKHFFLYFASYWFSKKESELIDKIEQKVESKSAVFYLIAASAACVLLFYLSMATWILS